LILIGDYTKHEIFPIETVIAEIKNFLWSSIKADILNFAMVSIRRYAKSKHCMRKWILVNTGRQEDEYGISRKPVKINVIYECGAEKVQYDIFINPSICFKTLVMLLLSRLSSNQNPSDFDIARVVEHGVSIKLKLQYSWNKSLESIGIEENDTLVITNNSSTAVKSCLRQSENTPKQTKRKSRKKNKTIDSTDATEADKTKHPTRTLQKPSSCSAKKRSQADYSLNVNTDKITHSKNLTLVFEEASEMFRERRQRLNNLALEKCPPKQKSTNSCIKKENPPPSLSGYSVDDQLGGKAGKTVYHVLVGPEEYLYKSSKSPRQHALSRPCSIDLHGCTRDEATTKLEESISIWMDAAMKEYPWTLRVDIITGGGNQILMRP
jgi:hypothetical protein